MRITTFRIFNTLKLASAITLGALLVACGGGSGSQLDSYSSRSGISSSAASTSSVDTTQFQSLGHGSGDSFIAGVIDTGIGNSSLSPGGVTTLTVNAVSGSRNLVTDSIAITFNSRCIAAGEALISNPSVTTTNGEARVIYTANGCVGNDLITATASHDGQVLTASTVLNVEADTIGSIRFIEANPSLISLKGTGGNEVSKVRFQVTGASDAPIKGVSVTFALTPADGNGEGIGGLKLTKNTGETDSGGYVEATIQSGTFPTSVRVRATAQNTNISTLSSELVVSTGIPDQKGMTIGVSDYSPAAWNYNGVEVSVTVGMADAFNNPAPDGTAVYFTTEGGVISPSCATDNGTDRPMQRDLAQRKSTP